MIRPAQHNAENNLLGRPNVVCTDTSIKQTNHWIYLTLNNLTIIRPNWLFVVSDHTHVIVTGFDIKEDGETLGSVSIRHKGSKHRIFVNNDRISKSLTRGKGYFTEDPIKAELRIRKTFFKDDKSERLVKARKFAEETVEKENSSKGYAVRSAEREWLYEAHPYVKDNVEAYLTAYPHLRERHAQWVAAVNQAITTTDVYKALESTDRHTLVVLNGPMYILSHRDTIQEHTDATLSEELRRKIGLLKLVNDSQMVSGVGCRVSETVFVILPDNPEGAKQ